METANDYMARCGEQAGLLKRRSAPAHSLEAATY